VTRVTAARIKDLDDDVGMSSKKYLTQDHILGPCLQRAAFFSLEIGLKAIITNEPSDEILNVADRELEDVLLFGFDKTLPTEDILRNAFHKAAAHVGVYYGNKDLSQLGGRILLPYAGSVHDKLAVKWTKKVVSIFPHQIIVLLINHTADGLDFLQTDHPKALPNHYIVSRSGDRMSAIVEELKSNAAITLLITGEIADQEGNLAGPHDPIDALYELTHIHCPFLLCSSRKDRKQNIVNLQSPEKESLHSAELKSVSTSTATTESSNSHVPLTQNRH